jgi:hypothetical protein
MKRLKFNILRSKSSIFVITVITFLIFLSHVCTAQIAIGPKVGLAVTSLEGTQLSNVDSRTTASGGLFVNFQLKEWINVQPEFLISQKGASYFRNTTSTDIRLHYFETPVLLKLRVPIHKTFYPHLLAGPNFAFNTEASYVSTDTQSGTVYHGSTSSIRRSDIGALLGAGLDIQSKRVFVTIDGRYGYSFNYLNNSETTQLKVRNTGWTLSIGIGLRLFTD